MIQRFCSGCKHKGGKQAGSRALCTHVGGSNSTVSRVTLNTWSYHPGPLPFLSTAVVSTVLAVTANDHPKVRREVPNKHLIACKLGAILNSTINYHIILLRLTQNREPSLWHLASRLPSMGSHTGRSAGRHSAL